MLLCISHVYLGFAELFNLLKSFLYQIAICKSYTIFYPPKISCLNIVECSNSILTYLGTNCFRKAPPHPHPPPIFIHISYPC